MTAPVFSLYKTLDGSLVTSGNKILFGNAGNVQKGQTSDIVSTQLWNDKGGGNNSDTAVAPLFFAVSGTGDMSAVFAGTAGNGFKSMLQARSCKATGVAADAQTDWTPIGPAATLVLGNMPKNSMREIQLRVVVPTDAGTLSLRDASFRVTA